MAIATSASATLVKVSAQGSVSNGPISAPGLMPGDIVVRIIPDGFIDGMESVVSIADQMQQTSMQDWSSLTLTFYLIRGV